MTLWLRFLSLSMPLWGLMASVNASQSDVLNHIEIQKTYRSPLIDSDDELFTPEEKQSLGPRDFLWQNINPDATGVFSLHFNPSLYQQDNLFLLLKHEPQQKPVARVTYDKERGIFNFLGLKDANFDLRSTRHQPYARPYLSHNIRDEEEGTLNEHEVRGDGNCALHCLGLSRLEAVR